MTKEFPRYQEVELFGGPYDGSKIRISPATEHVTYKDRADQKQVHVYTRLMDTLRFSYKGLQK